MKSEGTGSKRQIQNTRRNVVLPGPVPERLVGEFRMKQFVEVRPLASLSKIPAAKREQAECRIWQVQEAYLSTKAAVRLSPTKAQILAAVKEKQREIAQMVFWPSDPIPRLQVRASTPQRGERNVQFQSGISQLLERKGYSLNEYKKAAAKGLEAIRDYDRILTNLNAFIEKAAIDKIFVEVSEPELKLKFFRAIHRILADLEIGTTLGLKSKIVNIILEVWGEVFGDDDKELVRRKGLAREVKLAVKGEKGE